MSEPLVKIEKQKGGLVRLVLNDPDTRNAMSAKMAEEFRDAVTSVRSDASVRVVVLTGAGKAFSGGGHLDMLFEKTKIDKDENQRLMELFYEQFLSIRSIDVPVVAAMNGHAIGAGLCIALACDVRFISTSAKLGLNFVNIGLHPGMGATWLLPRLVGAAKAAELLFAGKIITAEEAARIGMVNAALAPEELDAAVAAFTDAAAAAGPLAVRQLKQSLRTTMELPLPEALSREASCQAENYAGPEFLEGIQAAKEKRKPKF